jgi:hypothetical protein
MPYFKKINNFNGLYFEDFPYTFRVDFNAFLIKHHLFKIVTYEGFFMH